MPFQQLVLYAPWTSSAPEAGMSSSLMVPFRYNLTQRYSCVLFPNGLGCHTCPNE